VRSARAVADVRYRCRARWIVFASERMEGLKSDKALVPLADNRSIS
jgi:hypothetical protein